MEHFTCSAQLDQMASPTVKLRPALSMRVHCSHASQCERVHGYGEEVKGPNEHPQI